MHGTFMGICTGIDTAQNQMRRKKYRLYQNWGRGKGGQQDIAYTNNADAKQCV